VEYRNTTAFRSRSELRQLFAARREAFEQRGAGLLLPYRNNAQNPLDRSAVHRKATREWQNAWRRPQLPVADLMATNSLRKRIDLHEVRDDKVGMPTLQDIMNETAPAGRAPRSSSCRSRFAEGVNQMRRPARGS
jgi:uncharacterized protein